MARASDEMDDEPIRKLSPVDAFCQWLEIRSDCRSPGHYQGPMTGSKQLIVVVMDGLHRLVDVGN